MMSVHFGLMEKFKMNKKSHNKASKPTGGQAACGLSNCYVDARIGGAKGWKI